MSRAVYSVAFSPDRLDSSWIVGSHRFIAEGSLIHKNAYGAISGVYGGVGAMLSVF